MSLIQMTPHSSNAEKTVLGCLLLDPDAIHKVIAKLKPIDFYDVVYRDIYSAICQLYADAKPIDFVTVADKLSENTQVQQLGGPAFLAELSIEVPTSSHIGTYCEMLLNRSTRRQLLKLGKDLVGLASEENKSTHELVESAEQQLLDIHCSSINQKPTKLKEMCIDRFEHYVNEITMNRFVCCLSQTCCGF